MATTEKTAKLPGMKDVSPGNGINPKGWGYYAPLPGVRYYIYVNEETTKPSEGAGERKNSEALQGNLEIARASEDGERR